MNRPIVLSPRDVADALDMSRRQIYRWIDQGKLPTSKVGRQHRITEEQLAEAVGEDLAEAVFDGV